MIFKINKPECYCYSHASYKTDIVISSVGINISVDITHCSIAGNTEHQCVTRGCYHCFWLENCPENIITIIFTEIKYGRTRSPTDLIFGRV
jgi:hypothetical protein